MSKAPSKVDQIRALGEATRARKNRPKGRPPKGEVRDRPWEKLGVSKATYYRKIGKSKG